MLKRRRAGSFRRGGHTDPPDQYRGYFLLAPLFGRGVAGLLIYARHAALVQLRET